MIEKDKKEIAKIMGEVLEANVLPVLDEMRQELKGEINFVKEEVNDVKEELVKTNRKLDNEIDRYDSKLENHEKRLTVLEKVKR